MLTSIQSSKSVELQSSPAAVMPARRYARYSSLGAVFTYTCDDSASVHSISPSAMLLSYQSPPRKYSPLTIPLCK